LAVETSGSHEGSALAVEREDAVEPVPLDLDQIPYIDKPDLMRSGGVPGTFVRIWWAFVPSGWMRTFVEGHHLPHGGVAIAIPKGVRRPGRCPATTA
jgi:hypothetical protein